MEGARGGQEQGHSPHCGCPPWRCGGALLAGMCMWWCDATQRRSLTRDMLVFAQTSLGHETPGGADVSDLEAFAASKTAFGAIPVSEGADTLLWAICAQNGVVQSGKHYYLRDVHSF